MINEERPTTAVTFQNTRKIVSSKVGEKAGHIQTIRNKNGSAYHAQQDRTQTFSDISYLRSIYLHYTVSQEV